MNKNIVINVSLGETRIAILENKTLVELYFELPEHERMVGDVYYGKVAKVLKGLQAAFVDIGHKQDAFLHFSDIEDRLIGFEPADKKNQQVKKQPQQKRNEGLPISRGDNLLVQITKEPISEKGARVTTGISLAGRYLVLVPNDHVVGVSRKILNRREKFRLKKIGRSICPPDFGLVIRTVAEGKDEASLKADLDNLMKSWEQLVKKMKVVNPPALVHKEVGMLSAVIRDLFTNDIETLVVDNKKMHKGNRQIHEGSFAAIGRSGDPA
jgi:ribonuclease G